MEIDPLVALQPNQPRARGGGERAGHLGLAHARLALHEQRLLERGRQVDGSREAPVGEIALARQGLLYGCGGVEAHDPAAASSARLVSTRARWRL